MADVETMRVTVTIATTLRVWDQADLDALIEAFRYRTGVDLTDPYHKPADAWAAYKARQRVWINRAHARRKLRP